MTKYSYAGQSRSSFRFFINYKLPKGRTSKKWTLGKSLKKNKATDMHWPEICPPLNSVGGGQKYYFFCLEEKNAGQCSSVFLEIQFWYFYWMESRFINWCMTIWEFCVRYALQIQSTTLKKLKKNYFKIGWFSKKKIPSKQKLSLHFPC